MANGLGDFDLSAVIYAKFTTVNPSTGAPLTLAGSPVLSVYKDNSTTQSTTGVTLTVDFDSVTGLNHFAIDTSTDATFYSAGSFFDIVITTGTVNSISAVGYCIGEFTIRKTAALKPTTPGRALDVSTGGEAGLDWANIGSPTTAVNLSATNIDVDQVVASVSGAVGSVTGAVGSIATGGIAAASFAAGAIDATAIATDAIGANELAASAISEIQSGLSSLDAAGIRAAVGLASANLDTQIDALPTNAELATALGTADDAVLAAIAALNNLSQANIRTAVGLASANLDTQLAAIAAYIDTEVGAIKAKTDLIPGTVDGKTLTQGWTLILAVLLGKASGMATTTAVFRAIDDSKDRVTATVDADGNRSAITLDAS